MNISHAMDKPQIEIPDVAGWFSGLTVLIGSIATGFYALKRRVRTDQAATVEQEGKITIWDGMQRELKRMHIANSDMAAQMEASRKQNHELSQQMLSLSQELMASRETNRLLTATVERQNRELAALHSVVEELSLKLRDFNDSAFGHVDL